MSQPDHYETLGVDKSATPDEIRQAYRRASAKYHPDREGGDEEKMKAINEAFETLCDPEKRKAYDEGGDIFARPVKPEEHLILDAFINSVAEDADGRYDWLDQTRTRLKNHKAHKAASAKAMRGQMRRLVRGLKKLKFKGNGSGLLVKVIETKISSLEREAKSLEEELPVYDRALAMLDDYDWQAEPGESRASEGLYGHSSIADALDHARFNFR